MQVREVLRLLIESRQISEWRLANETGVSQSTINAILSGRSREQKDSTLQPLADFFECTLAQLRGYEAIEGLHKGQIPPNRYPVIADEAVSGWITEQLPKTYFVEFVPSAVPKGRRCFVYTAKDDAVAPEISQGQRVFIDPDATPTTDPARTPIALIEVSGHYALRSEVTDLGTRIYKATSAGFRTIEAKECRVIGYAVGVPEEDWTHI